MTAKDYAEWNPELSEQEEVEVVRCMEHIQRGVPVMRAFRDRLGVTQEELAELLGVTQSNVSKMEAGPEPRWSALRTLVEHKGGRLTMVLEIDGERLEWPFSPAA